MILSAANYLFSLSMARLLPDADFIDYVGAQSVLLVIGTGVMAAIPWVMSHEMSRSPASESKDSDVLGFGLLAAAAQGVLVAVLAAVLCWHMGGAPLALTAASAAFALSLVAAPVGFLQGRRSFRSVALLRLFEGSVRISAGLALVTLVQDNAVSAIAGLPIGSLALVVCGLALCSRWPLKLRLGAIDLLRLARRAVRLGSIQILIIFVASVDTVVLAVSDLTTSAGFNYQTAALLGRAPLFIALALAQALYPTLVSSTEAQARHELRRATGLYLRIAILAIVGSMTVPASMLAVVAGGEAAAEVASLLHATTIAGALMGLTALIATAHQARGGRPTSVLVLVVGAASAPALMLLAADHGPTPLAQTSAACAVVICSALILTLRSWRPVDLMAPDLWLRAATAIAIATTASILGGALVWILAMTLAAAAMAAPVRPVRRRRATLPHRGRTPATSAATPHRGLDRQLGGLGRSRSGAHRSPSILVFGNVGNGNTGDEALLAVTLAHVDPDADLQVVSRHPEAVTRLHGTQAVSMSGLPVLKALSRCDAVVVVGGGMFGPGAPTLVRLLPLLIEAVARMGRETAVVGIGVYDGAPRHVVRSLRRLTRVGRGITVRDHESAALLGGPTTAPLVGDLALLLQAAPAESAQKLLSDAKADAGRSGAHGPLLLLAPKGSTDAARTDRLVEVSASAARWWSDRGGEVVGLCFAERPDHGIASEASDRDLVARIAQISGVPVAMVGPNLHPAVALAVTAEAAAVIGLRFHAVVFAHQAGVPVASFPWESKTARFLSDHGLTSIDEGGDALSWLSTAGTTEQMGAPR